MALFRVQFFTLVVVSVVQDGLQLSRTSGLVQEVFSKAFTLLWKLLVLLSELILHLKRMCFVKEAFVWMLNLYIQAWPPTEVTCFLKLFKNWAKTFLQETVQTCSTAGRAFFHWQWTQLEEIYNYTNLTELFEFPAKSKGCEDGIFAGQCNEWWWGQSLVDIEARPRMSKTVNLWEQRD